MPYGTIGHFGHFYVEKYFYVAWQKELKMSSKKIVLMWIPEGVVPKSGKTFDEDNAIRLGYDRYEHSTLRSAVDQALQDREPRKIKRLLPYIKVSSGEGAAIFGIQEIIVIIKNIP
jgi:hypothetical protein